MVVLYARIYSYEPYTEYQFSSVITNQDCAFSSNFGGTIRGQFYYCEGMNAVGSPHFFF